MKDDKTRALIERIEHCIDHHTEIPTVAMETLHLCKAALSQKQEAVGVVNYADHQTGSQLFDQDTPLRMAVEETAPKSIQGLPKGTKLYTAPPSTAQGINDGLERILTMADEDVMKEASATYDDVESEVAKTRKVINSAIEQSKRLPQGVEELLENDWCYAHECKAGERVYDITAVRKLLASQPTAQDRMVSEALERELNMIHMTINSFESPTKAIQELISWHISVEKDPKVNGGMVMVPVEPTEELVNAIDMAMRTGTADDAYKAMLKAASKEN